MFFCYTSAPSCGVQYVVYFQGIFVHMTQQDSGWNPDCLCVRKTDWDADRERLVALLTVTWWWSRQTSFPKPWWVHPLEYSQFMGLSWRNHATLWLFPWGFIYCRGTALANKYEFRLISSCLVIIKSLSKDIINMQRVSLIICMGYSWVQAFPFFCA